MPYQREVYKRNCFTALFFLIALAVFSPFSAMALEKVLSPTSDQAEGPYYPAVKPADQDTDLTAVKGKPGKAKGQVIYVSGRVLNTKGGPVAGARVEIWQANAFGRYGHPKETSQAALDPNFEGYGVTSTDAEGHYRYKTIKPGAYKASADWTRPPHIHFMVTTSTSRLITQLYFEGEPLNDKDSLFQSASDKKTLIVKLMPAAKEQEADALMATWDIVLQIK